MTLAFFRNSISLIFNYSYDFQRYWKYSSSIHPPRELAQLEAKIQARFHNIEKSLSLSNVRLGFGKEKINVLLSFLDLYVSLGYDQNRVIFQTALSVLHSYVEYHETRDFDAGWLKERLLKYQDLHFDLGGTIELNREDIIAKEMGNFENLALNRHSIRHFSEQEVSEDLVTKAIQIAQKAPSVCNRQSGRAYVVTDSRLKENLLIIHKGSDSFGKSAKMLIVVTSDVRTFTSVGERNQNYIDGSLFGMSLIYALHSLGLATCALNWSVTKSDDVKMHKIIEIPGYETIIFLIAVGHYPEIFRVAKSSRQAIGNVMKIKGDSQRRT